MRISRRVVFVASATLFALGSGAFGQTPQGAVVPPTDMGGQISPDSSSSPDIARGKAGVPAGTAERTGGVPASAVEKNVNYGWF